MKHVLLSEGYGPAVYLVPDIVADNLEKYCYDFINWMATSPHAEVYRVNVGDFIGYCFDSRDFIKYLNAWVFQDNPSQFVDALTNGIPKKYRNCMRFDF